MATTKEGSNNTKKKAKKDAEVVLHDYGTIPGGSPLPNDWPCGRKYMEMMSRCHDAPILNTTEEYWQTSARWALLNKYKYLPECLEGPYVQNKDGSRQLCFTESDTQTIRQVWEQLLQQESQSQQSPCSKSDLLEFLQTSKSCGRQLEWSVMEIPAALQFKLHAHPNLELVYCARGALHEVRMSGEPFLRKFDASREIQGPDLSHLNRSWYFDTLHQGEWLVNEVGSIHKSFTATNGQGCTLIVLWGGSHADIPLHHEPTRVNVQGAVEIMDDKVSSACDCNNGATLSETFLPASERRLQL